MAIDSYSLCPGGTGKKIKFCCPDLLSDLKTLDRMMEGEQYKAALQHIESIESAESPRACLLAIKIRLLRAAERDEDARAAVNHFVEHFPDNPIALAESAIDVAVARDGPAAMQLLQRALEADCEQLYAQVYGAMSVVAQSLASSGYLRSAQALWHLQTMASSDDPQPRELLTTINRSEAVPLLLKDEPRLDECPAGVAWKDSFDHAMQPLAKAHWAEVTRRLDKLVESFPDEPVLWQNLAIVRSWLADRAGAIDAFEKLASLDIPLENAVEAAATAMMMADNPLDDSVDGLRLTFPVEDGDELAGLFSTWKLAVAMPLDASTLAEEEVPPKAMFWLLDRPTPESAKDLTLEAVSNVLGQAMLFGRQTDCGARLIVSGVTSSNLDRVIESLGEVAQKQITSPPEQEVVARLSATRLLLRRPWRLPPDSSRETITALAERHLEHSVFEAWPRLALGVFGGRSAEQVAADPSQRVKLLAAILVLENWVSQMGEPLEFNRLRSQLGLPTLGPIDPEQSPPEDLPLVRLHRVVVEKLPNDALLNSFHRAVVYGADEAVAVLGRAVVERPDIASDQLLAALAILARSERDPERAFGYIARGRELAESGGQSSASWDLSELELRLAHGDSDEGARLFEHLKQEHLREPGVAQALRDFLMRAGIIDADGRPIAADVPETAEDQPASQLWTPGSEKSTAGKSKLWTPDME
ncbi:MAG: hypothetical protein JW888_05540 [Pirellulales bacterium]|nr:hypothetical protein [Pirellulales bacterium]